MGVSTPKNEEKFSAVGAAVSVEMLPIPWATAIQFPGAIFHPDEAGKARLERFFRLPYFSRTWVMRGG